MIEDVYNAGIAPPATILGSRFVYCDGSLPAYLVTVGGSAAYQAAIIDLAAGGATRDLSGSTVTGYQVTRPSGSLTVATPAVTFTADSILNAARSPAISPGGIISIFGTGLSGAASATAVSIGGQPATVLLATPFQVNAQVPPSVPPGDSRVVLVSSPFGSQSQTTTVQAVLSRYLCYRYSC